MKCSLNCFLAFRSMAFVEPNKTAYVPTNSHPYKPSHSWKNEWNSHTWSCPQALLSAPWQRGSKHSPSLLPPSPFQSKAVGIEPKLAGILSAPLNKACLFVSHSTLTPQTWVSAFPWPPWLNSDTDQTPDETPAPPQLPSTMNLDPLLSVAPPPVKLTNV